MPKISFIPKNALMLLFAFCAAVIGYAQDVPRLTGDRQHPSAYSLGFYDFPMAVLK